MAKRLKMQQKTLGSQFDEFLLSRKENGCVQNTINSYKGLMHCIGIDMTQPFDKIDWKQIILDIRNKDVSPTTINTYLRTIKIFMKWCGITDNLPVLTKVETAKNLYTDEELKRLIKRPNKNCSYAEYRNWCIVLLVLDTGLRAASIRNILNKDIDLNNNTVYIRHNKTHKVQILPFSDTTRNALRTLQKVTESTLGNNPDNYLFVNVYGQQMGENGLWCAIEKYNKSRGVDKSSLHLLRHNFSRAWVVNGGDPFSLQQMLGHADLTMTRHYCQLYSNDLMNKYKSPVEQLTRTQIKK